MKLIYWFIMLYFIFPVQLCGDRKDIGCFDKYLWCKYHIGLRKNSYKTKNRIENVLFCF